MRDECLVLFLLVLILTLALLLASVEMALILLSLRHTAGMRMIFGALEVYHAVDAGERCAPALIGVRIELLLGEDVTTSLR